MKVWISDDKDNEIACLQLEQSSCGGYQVKCVEGELPQGLTTADLLELGIVKYESGAKGRPIPKVCPITPSEGLDYLRALIEAMPPGFFVSKVESKKIDLLREAKIKRFHQEFEDLDKDRENIL